MTLQTSAPAAAAADHTSPVLLRVENLNAFYDRIHALKDVSLDVREGEIVCLIGANGAGKSTLVKCIAGLLRPRTGRVTFAGEQLNGRAPEEIVRHGIGLVPEGRRVFPVLTVEENLEIGGYTRPRSELQTALERVYSLFPILAERRAQLAGSLSGGEQQMLAIGRALMAQPRLLLLDEPSLGLAPRIVAQVFDLLARLNREGMSLLLVEQNAMKALQLAHRGCVLETGRLVLADRAAALLANPKVKEAYLGA